MQTKKELIIKAEGLFDEIEENDRYENGKNYHAVNVKQHHQKPVIIEEIVKEYPQKYQKRIIEYFIEDYTTSLYFEWLQFETEYIFAILKHNFEEYLMAYETEEEREAMNKISEVYQAGRMGGWVIFQFTSEAIQELDDIINFEEDYSEEEIKEIIKMGKKEAGEIETIKNFIKNFSDNLHFERELKFRIEEYIEELKEEEKEKAKMTKEAKANKSETMHSKLSEMLLSDNEAIKRHAKGIYKELQKE